MPNPHRGEIEALFDGRPYTLCLTLGALAELEHAFGSANILDVVKRITSGHLTANEATLIIGAGLRAAGHNVPNADVAAMRSENGIAGAIDVVARLLAASFSEPASIPSHATQTSPAAADHRPFPGAQ